MHRCRGRPPATVRAIGPAPPVPEDVQVGAPWQPPSSSAVGGPFDVLPHVPPVDRGGNPRPAPRNPRRETTGVSGVLRPDGGDPWPGQRRDAESRLRAARPSGGPPSSGSSSRNAPAAWRACSAPPSAPSATWCSIWCRSTTNIRGWPGRATPSRRRFRPRCRDNAGQHVLIVTGSGRRRGPARPSSAESSRSWWAATRGMPGSSRSASAGSAPWCTRCRAAARWRTRSTSPSPPTPTRSGT